MKKNTALLRVAWGLGTLLCATHLHAAPPADLGKRLVDGYIRPATAQLETATTQLGSALSAYCASPADEEARSAMEQRFGETVDAWSRIEILRFGPLVEDNRFERFFFFPDPRGVTLRQMQALLATNESDAASAEALKTRSVAVQGLPALEYALFGGNAAEQIATDAPPGRYRCSFAQAVATNLHGIAVELSTAWGRKGRIAQEFSAPMRTHEQYRSRDEVAAEALKAMSTVLQYARDIKLLPALGGSLEEARGQRAPLWRSGYTQRSIAGNVGALLDFYRAGGFAETLAADSRWISDNLASEAGVAVESVLGVPLRFDAAVVDAEAREQLVLTALVIKNLQSIVVEYLAPALGVNIGFNALDGD